MQNGNRISATLTEEATHQIETHLAAIEALLPFLITLQPDESKGLRHLGFDGVPYAQAGLDAVRADMAFTRRSFDLPEYERDVTLLDQLRRVRARLAPLAQKVDDTYRLTGADVMVAADDIYEDLRKDNGETAAVQAPLAQMRRRYQYRKAAPANPAPAK